MFSVSYIMGPLLQIRTLRLRKVKRIIPSHTGCKWLEPAIRVFFFLSFFFGLPLSKQLERESQCPGLGCLISASAAVAPCPAHREDKPVLLMVSAGHPPGGGCHFYTAPSSLPPPSSLPVSTRGLYSFCLLWLVPEPQT